MDLFSTLLSSEVVSVRDTDGDLGEGSRLELVPAQLEEQAGLTLAALGSEAEPWVVRFEQLTGSAPEPEAFLDFVIARATDRAVSSVARFERALGVARAARAQGLRERSAARGQRLCLHPAAAVIDLPGPAEEVIGAIALGLSPPAHSGWPVLVAPGLPTLWRQATPLEDVLCTWLTRPRCIAEIHDRFVGVDRVLERLLSARAVVEAE